MTEFYTAGFDLHMRCYSGRRETPEFHGGTALTVIPSLARLMGWQELIITELGNVVTMCMLGYGTHIVTPHACTGVLFITASARI